MLTSLAQLDVLSSTDVLGGLMKRECNLAEARQVNTDPPGIAAKLSGDKMSGFMMVGCILSNELLGLTEYYDAVLSRTGLVKKESEFRTNKLSMILEFIRTICISENTKIELTSAIIEAWRLQVPERSLIQREEELRKVMDSICRIKNLAKWIEWRKDPMNGSQLNFRVLSDLPIAPSDFRSEDVPKIYNLLSQIMDYCISITESNLCLSPETSRS